MKRIWGKLLWAGPGYYNHSELCTQAFGCCVFVAAHKNYFCLPVLFEIFKFRAAHALMCSGLHKPGKKRMIDHFLDYTPEVWQVSTLFRFGF